MPVSTSFSVRLSVTVRLVDAWSIPWMLLGFIGVAGDYSWSIMLAELLVVGSTPFIEPAALSCGCHLDARIVEAGPKGDVRAGIGGNQRRNCLPGAARR